MLVKRADLPPPVNKCWSQVLVKSAEQYYLYKYGECIYNIIMIYESE